MKSSLKRILHLLIPERSAIYFQFWMKFIWKPKKGSIDWHLNEFSKHNSDVFFLQIGANDGFLGDPIYKYIRRDAWSGILVEPVPYLFHQLQSNYASFTEKGQLFFEPVAISDEEGIKDFYYVKDFAPTKDLPVYLNQQGSFSKMHLDKVKEKYPKVEIGVMPVSTKKVSSIIDKYKPEKIDLIHIDTEGHDFAILESIDFDRLNPRMVYFEHRHNTRAERDRIIGWLDSFGYQILEEKYDTFAWKTAPVAVTYARPKEVMYS